jgi:hypothetical protein
MDPYESSEIINLIKWTKFDPYVAKYNFNHFKPSKKKYINDKKLLDDLKLVIIKNILILNEILLQNGYDKDGKLTTLIVVLFDNCILNNTNEDENYLLIVVLLKLESYSIGI